MLYSQVRGILVLLFSLLVIGCRGSSTEPAGEPAGPPNIVLVFADDLGYGDLSIYGHPSIHTPRLDRMALEGIRLTSFYAASPVCSPSRAALLTGRYPARSGLTRVLGPDAETGLPADELTLAEALKAEGYRTAAFGKWHLGGTEGFFPTDHGFDEYYGLLYSNDMMPPWVNTERPLRLYRGTEPVDEYPVEQTTLTERYTEEAVRFIRESDGAPFFVYVPYAMPHLPIYASERFAGQSAGGLYGDVIETIDWGVGRILDVLDEEGLAENTIVIFTSDNGPWSNMPPRMYETEEVEQWDAGSTGPFRGAKGTTWEGGVRVPCIIRWPGRIPPNQLSAEMASTLDLYPTLLNLAGAALPSDRTVDGLDLWGLLSGTAGSPRDTFFYFINEELHGVREGPWKLHTSNKGENPLKHGDRDYGPPTGPALYNLTVDPSEWFNVAGQHPNIAQRLVTQMRDMAAETGVTIDGPLNVER